MNPQVHRLNCRMAIVFGVVALTTACGGDSSPAGPGGSTGGPDVATVTVAALAAPLVVADSQRLTATAKDSRGDVLIGRTTTWASSSPEIATVSSDGTVVGVGPGTATITATVEGHSGATPVIVALDPARSLAVGAAFSCALAATGAAYCWGANSQGQLGTNDNPPISPPTRVAGGLTFVEISVNSGGGCGVTPQRTAHCWGSMYLGNGTSASSLVPVVVSGALQFRSIAVGSRFACGLTWGRLVYCWGENAEAQLGTPPTASVVTTPTPVASSQTFVQISAGDAHVCALTAAGAAYCWGSNLGGQIGTGTTSTQGQPNPFAVLGGVVFRRLSAGTQTTCGVTTSAAVYCWGTNNFGSVGNGSIAQTVVGSPTLVTGASAVVGVSAGNSADQHSPVCAWTQSGTASCWGANHSGQLGTSASLSTCSFSTPCAPAPTAVAGPTDFTAVASAADHSCGMTRRHTVYCWGANGAGGLGDGTLSNRPTPVAVVGLPATP